MYKLNVMWIWVGLIMIYSSYSHAVTRSSGQRFATNPTIEHRFLDDYRLMDKHIEYPQVQLYSCQDLSAIDVRLAQQCKSFYNILMSKRGTTSAQTCDSDSPEERSQCQGLMTAAKLSTCEGLDRLGEKTCQAFQQAAIKACSDHDSGCRDISQYIHSYANCMDFKYKDQIFACVGFQNAYLDGISHSWAVDRFLPFAKKNLTNFENQELTPPALAYIPESRLRNLNISVNDLQALQQSFPTLMRSVLLNFPNSRTLNSEKTEMWREIEKRLQPEQTIGFELECPGVKLDITSGKSIESTSKHLASGETLHLSPEEVKRKMLAFDASILRDTPEVSQSGFWKTKSEWTYFDTYGSSLFRSQETAMNLPLVHATLESRYSFKQFPHIELVTAPLTSESSPLNHKNIMAYLSHFTAQTCSLENPRHIQFTSIQEWRNKVNTASSSKKYHLNYGDSSTRFNHSPMTCNVKKLSSCHVQSNVGVYFDQLFTDAYLVQSIGSNIDYQADEVYQASWQIAKNIFSVLQWDRAQDMPVDARNHAAGVFTYNIYNLFLRSILYAGKFDFWKGTISQLMKAELRDTWKTLNDSTMGEDEQELYQKAALMLWSNKEFPAPLASHVQRVLNDFMQASEKDGDPGMPTGRVEFDQDFPKKAYAVFQEMLWTISLANDRTYQNADSTYWGHIVSEDLTYRDPNDGTIKVRKGFIKGCAYATHSGSQCDIAKVIRPVRTQKRIQGNTYDRVYGVIETRSGNADFNQSIFWQCHENDRNDILGHNCRH